MLTNPNKDPQFTSVRNSFDNCVILHLELVVSVVSEFSKLMYPRTSVRTFVKKQTSSRESKNHEIEDTLETSRLLLLFLY